MKRLVVICIMILACAPIMGYASPQEDYEEAYKIYLAAGASAAAYSDRMGELAKHYLTQNGWKIDHYVQVKGRTGARYLIAQKEGVPYHFVAIVGTENKGDIRLDLKVDKVYFAGSDDTEFAANAKKTNVPDSEPKVHRGFYEFVQSGPSAVLRSPRHTNLSLSDLLLTDNTHKLYLTGHSLGGAAATLGGARLLSLGVSPAQMEIITFGAPAVGNAAFADAFSPPLPLTRIIHAGDPATGVLQKLLGDYQQFGREVKWAPPDTVDDAHKLSGYLDSAIKNYYNKRRLAVEAGMKLPSLSSTTPDNVGQRVYILPLKNNLPTTLTADFWYMSEALQDEYSNTCSNHIAADTPLPSWRQTAAASGCRWAIASEVSASRVKEKKNTYYITISQTIYDTSTGTAIDTAVFSTGTYNLTPLEAFIHACKGMNSHLATVLINHAAQ